MVEILSYLRSALKNSSIPAVLMILLPPVWIIGFFAALIRYLHSYRTIQRQLHLNAIPAEDHITRMIKGIDPFCPVKVSISPDISVPVTTGVLHPYIFLPDYKYEETSIYYILLHEYVHWKNHDLLNKVFLSLLLCIFWWLPSSHALYRRYTEYLESRCDYIIARQLNERQIVDYLQSLHDTMVLCRNKNPYLRTDAATMQLLNPSQGDGSFMRRRFHTLLNFRRH